MTTIAQRMLADAENRRLRRLARLTGRSVDDLLAERAEEARLARLTEKVSLDLLGSLVPELKKGLRSQTDELARRLAAALPSQGLRVDEAASVDVAATAERIPITDMDAVIAHLARENRMIEG